MQPDTKQCFFMIHIKPSLPVSVEGLGSAKNAEYIHTEYELSMNQQNMPWAGLHTTWPELYISLWPGFGFDLTELH